MQYFVMGFSIHIHGIKQDGSGDIGSKLPVFIFIITKLSEKSQRSVEFSMGDVNKPQMCKDNEHAISLVKEQQDYVMVMDRLAKSKLDDILSIELWGDNETNNNSQDPRYTLTLVDGDMVNGFYGVFIVPEGRETEWQFSSENGRRELAEVIGYKRLAIASLHRGHTYENIDQIKEELSQKVLDVAPPGMPNKYKVPFMSAGESTGYRKVQFDGKTNLSGSVVIQDVQNEDQTYTRQLIFSQMNKVVQSETRIINDPSKKKKKKNKDRVPDSSYLLWDIYKAMLVAFHFIPNVNLTSQDETLDVLLIGVGGAALPSFISKTFEKIRMTCVELDGELLDLAKTWFGAEETEAVQYVTQDGLQFIQEKVDQAQQDIYDVIIFDVGGLDDGRIFVPPKAFIEEGVLKNTRTLLKEKGALLINTNPSRVDNNEEMISIIKRFHSNVYRFDLPNSSNKPIVCTNNSFNFDSVYTKTKDLQKYVHGRTNGKINISNFDLESIIDYVITE
ncbi:eEF1A lysine and N-terminal methyltransferase-like isoform X2 [Clytia hemisphaerica]